MKIELNKIYNSDNAEFTPQIPDGSLDIILEDPPYLYLKNQKLDRPFDELAHFTECHRMLREGGFIVIFGRGESFYRWNTILADLGFEFKEEIIWNKSYCSSPLMPISRVHETVAIWSKGKAKINKVKVPYLEMKQDDIPAICQDIKRLRTILKNTTSLDAVLQFLKNNEVPTNSDNVLFASIPPIIRTDLNKLTGYGATGASRNKSEKPVTVMQSVTFWMNEKSIIKACDLNKKDRVNGYNASTTVGLKNGDRCAYVVQNIQNGMNEKTIIKQPREHYSTIHPTQKPPRLLERLLALVIPKDKPREEIKVADFFGGSCNTAKACITMGVNYIITEIDKEYFDLGYKSVEKFKEEFQPSLFV